MPTLHEHIAPKCDMDSPAFIAANLLMKHRIDNQIYSRFVYSKSPDPQR